MSTQEPGRRPTPLTSLPRIEDLQRAGEGYDPDAVSEAFETFRRHSAQLQAQLRVLQAAGRSPHTVEPTGHAVRMDALHLIRAAAEFADTVENDAQRASASQLAKTEEEVRRRQRELQEREAELERYRQESERQRAEMLNNARNEARELIANSNRDATQELQEAEARGNRLLEQARHQATELTNAARAEVEQTLEWSRAQATAILARAQNGAEQLLAAAGLKDEEIARVANAIVESTREKAESRRAGAASRPAAAMAAGPPEPEADDEEKRVKEHSGPAVPQAEGAPPSPTPAGPQVSPTPEPAEGAEADEAAGQPDEQQP
jgi:predicted ribosome quality control (RQC) complex YloA/Tae2 family protein